MFTNGVKLLKIFTAEKDRVDGIPFYEWIVQTAAANGIAGATVIYGIGGFCASAPVRSPRLLNFQVNKPVIIEIIDTPARIEEFVKLIDDHVPRGIMTIQDISIRYYGKNKEKK